MTRMGRAVVGTVFILGLAAGSASAQDTSDVVSAVRVNIVLDDNNVEAADHRYTINLDDCRSLAADPQDEIALIWDFVRNPPSGSQYTVKVRDPTESCTTSSLTREDSDECEVILQQEPLSGSSLRVNLTWEEITGVTDRDSCAGLSEAHDVILIFDTFTVTTDQTDDTDFDEVRFQFETRRPNAPTNVEVEAGESSLRVSWNAVDGAESYDVFYSSEPLESGSAPEDLVSSFSNTTAESVGIDDGIRRDVTYYAAVSTIDEFGNPSLLSEVVSATTQQVTDFWELYKQKGGGEPGCSSAGAGAPPAWLWLVLAIAVAPVFRRSRPRRRAHRGPAALALCLTLGAASNGAAQDTIQSTISGEIELKFGEYEPSIDDEFAGQGPYESVFGPGGTLYAEVEYSHYLWREVGSVAFAVGVGVTSNSGQGINADGTASVDDTNLTFVPIRVSGVYRFDMLAREWNIPFVPYAKFGFDAYVWWIKSAAGIATYRDPTSGELDQGRGVVFGWHTALGLQFLLDVLAPAMSRTFDASSGVNNSYLFAEWLYADIDDFGSDTSLRLGDSTFLFGIAFEF